MKNREQMREQEILRKRLSNWCGERGRGAVQEVESATKISRHTIRLFRAGGNASLDTMGAIDEFLKQQEQAGYTTTVSEGNPYLLMARELEMVADTLRSPSVDDWVKFNRLETFVKKALSGKHVGQPQEGAQRQACRLSQRRVNRRQLSVPYAPPFVD